MALASWKETLGDRIPAPLGEEIDIYETELELKRQDKIDEKVFAETRLRRGVYGQRYDNGHRHDGVESRKLDYPSGERTKGPTTLWDAPGMMRIKIPFGALDGDQMRTLAELAEEYSDSILHVSTRQDIQLHFVHIDDTPTIMRRLAAVGVTTREACGNSVRNVTACPRSGVCPDETFDVTPYSRALAYFLLGHKDAQDFGRKFKVSFSGCAGHACGLAAMHDIGAIARVRTHGGAQQRGFEIYVGGGLGPVPHQAELFDAFLPEAELLPVAQAICRVFARLGEKRNRSRARLKFLVAKLGIDEFRRMVLEERAALPDDEAWTSFLDDTSTPFDGPTREATTLGPGPFSEEFERWRSTNVEEQRQEGYAIATVCLPLGDLTAEQMRSLAAIGETYSDGRVRTTVEQNIALRWISRADLPALHDDLVACGLGEAGASTLVDITACPGTDTCKLGISSSRGLAAELRKRIAARNFELDEAVKNLHIKVSGCFNSCGQHHISDIGFYGVSRRVGSHTVPHFQIMLGGQWHENAGAYGLATLAVPSRAIPEVVERITGFFVAEREEGESFQAFVRRVGKARVKELLEDLTEVPPHAVDRSYYSDWGDPREYTIGDMGVGECAGEVVSVVEFGLAASERVVFEALIDLENGDVEAASSKAYDAMLRAAKAMNQSQDADSPDGEDQIVRDFRTRFHDTKIFHDPFAGSKFANYLFSAHEDSAHENGDGNGAAAAHRRIEEARLFVEAAHACYNRMSVA